MSIPSRALVDALRATADRLSGGARYNWTHMGACNCGHLAQTVTELSAAEIHAMALERRGDWRDQVLQDEAQPEYCPTSGLPMEQLVERLLQLGLTRADLAHLERLSDKQVLRAVPEAERPLDYRRRSHVVLYMRTLAEQLERRLEAELQGVREEGRPRQRAPETVG